MVKTGVIGFDERDLGGSQSFSSSGVYVEFCPNDQTRLVSDSAGIGMSSVGGRRSYHESVHCPVCAYQVERRPSDVDVARINVSLQEVVGAYGFS